MPDTRRNLLCDCCGSTEFDDGEDGFYYCSQCGSQSQDVVDTAYADDDVYASEVPGVTSVGGGLYSQYYHRSTPKPSSHEESLKASKEIGKDEEPRDFGGRSMPLWTDPEALACGIRTRYVRGVQVMLQKLCEVLVERHGVSPIICGIVPSIWLRYVAEKKVFDKDWGPGVIAKFKAKEEESNNPNRKKVEFVIIRALRSTVPLYSTLCICFLACHIAREPVLPTDIHEWVLEFKLPYISIFTELDKYLGNRASTCPLESKQMFRPVRVISPCQLEAISGLIAGLIGLSLPPVNFYAVSRRCLESLSLPSKKILPFACRLYQWLLPTELWLNSSQYGLPTRVYVMGILVISLRILYDLNGQGTWEKGLCGANDLKDCGVESSEYGARELLNVLESAPDKIGFKPEYSKDLSSCQKHCRENIFVGMKTSLAERTLGEIFSDICTKEDSDDDVDDDNDNNKQENIKSEPDDPKAEGNYTNAGTKKQSYNNGCLKPHKKPQKTVCIEPTYSRASYKSEQIEKMRREMEENDFVYLPPITDERKSKDYYLHYKRKRQNGVYVYCAHADYYILLRAFAVLARIDVRAMHNGVLQLERKLDWIEHRIKLDFKP